MLKLFQSTSKAILRNRSPISPLLSSVSPTLFNSNRGLSHGHDQKQYHSIEFKLHDLSGLNFYVHSHHNTCDTIHHHGQTGLKVRSDNHHPTKETGDWFQNKIQHGGALGLRVEDLKHPSKLFFAFTGDLELTVGQDLHKISNIVCGQGHDNGNNWWIGGGGKNFQRRHLYDASGNHPALLCHTDGGDVVIFTHCKTGVENCFAVTVLKKEN